MTQSSGKLIELANEQVKNYKRQVTQDPNRLHYHIMPPVGHLNDPNGFIHFKGKYHMFYQWNPFETEHGAKFWGHQVSSDLVHWEEMPIALAPDSWFDKNGCYSGSAVEYEGKMYVFYTGNVKDENGERETYQCLAVSDDGIHFEKKGPVIHLPKGYTAHFRDPKVWRENGLWHMILGAQTESLHGEAVLYTSSDMENWDFHGPVAGSFQNGMEEFGYMWECPDLFQLDGKDILLVCPQGLEAEDIRYQNVFQSGYFAGERHGYERYEHGDFQELDRGFDFYAPQTTETNDGRRILVGWMGNAEEPGAIQPTANHHWIHALTLPRELTWEKGRLLQRPIKELELLRKKTAFQGEVKLEHATKAFPELSTHVMELAIDVLEFTDNLVIKLGNTVKLIYNKEKGLFTLERRSFTKEKSLEQRHCHLDELQRIHLFKDTSSVEVFLNDGEEVFTARVFEIGESDILEIETETFAHLEMKQWEQKKVMD